MSQKSNFETIRQQMLQEGYTEQMNTMSAVKANYLSLLMTVPLLAAFFALYQWTRGGVWDILDSIPLMVAFLIGLFVSIVVHELIHGLTWSFSCQKGIKSITFGVLWSSLTPYCHCKEALSRSQYIIGALMPFFILGIGLTVVGTAAGNVLLFWLGLFNILAAGGDLLISWMLRRCKQGKIVDHPSEIGFVHYKMEKES